MRIKLALTIFAAILLVGCGSGDNVTETKIAPTGEIEGKEPSFKMVPSQKDPNYPGGK